MKFMIVYDSFFGNTEQIARAIGDSLGPAEEVGVFKVGNAPGGELSKLDLLVVGSPTRGFRPTPAVADFLKNLPANALQGVRAAAFDTRISPDDIKSGVLRFMVKLGGFAAKPIADGLVKKGATLLMPGEGFFVEDQQGPLKPGELERAATWAKSLIAVPDRQ
jgi:flavodoxin I